MVALEKAVLRKEILQRRGQIPAEQLKNCSQQLCLLLLPWLRQKGIITLALYRSFRAEPSLDSLEKAWPSSHCYYPRIDPKTSTMQFHRRPADGIFLRNSFGIEEPPASNPLLLPSSSTAIIVPALAYDHAGHRLGYGGGFYDRYLSHFPGLSLGVCFAAFRFERLPQAEHDRSVNHVATEAAIY